MLVSRSKARTNSGDNNAANIRLDRLRRRARPTAVQAQNTPAPPNARAYIIWPPDGQVIQGGKLWVRMGLKNMGVAPAGVASPNTGHHHLLVNTGLPPLDEPIPNDKNHLHFGGGQTEARLIDLPPGEYPCSCCWAIPTTSSTIRR